MSFLPPKSAGSGVPPLSGFLRSWQAGSPPTGTDLYPSEPILQPADAVLHPVKRPTAKLCRIGNRRSRRRESMGTECIQMQLRRNSIFIQRFDKTKAVHRRYCGIRSCRCDKTGTGLTVHRLVCARRTLCADCCQPF